MERFYIKDLVIKDLATGKTSFTITDREVLHKIKNVLRLKAGSFIVVFGSDQKEYQAKIKNLSGTAAILEEIIPIDASETETEAAVQILLYPSLFKKNHFEWMLEKCTEIGVSSFHPVLSKRSVVKTEAVPERWNKIITEASLQSGRTLIPAIEAPENLKQALQNISAGIIIVAAENQESTDHENKNITNQSPIHLFIGPEGGWDPAELDLFREKGAIFMNLGKRILRAETACIIFSAFYIYNKI